MTPERLDVLRKTAKVHGAKSNALLIELIAALDAERTAHAETRRERDVLNKLLTAFSANVYAVLVPMFPKKSVVFIGEGWEITGDKNIYPTALDAIRAALAQQKQQEQQEKM